MIQIEHLYKTYTSEKHDEEHHALKDINLTIIPIVFIPWCLQFPDPEF